MVCFKVICSCEGFTWEIKAQGENCLLGPWKPRHRTRISAAPGVTAVSLRLYTNVSVVFIIKRSFC